MKIFVTTGSAFPFDSLVKFLDLNFSNDFHEITFQIGKGKYIPQNHRYFRFVNNIEQYFKESNLIICHAGAGTIYNLLEQAYPFITVPNFDRKDPHQKDICDYLSEKNLACSIFNFHELKSKIKNYNISDYNPYTNNNTKILDFLTITMKYNSQ